MFSVSVFEIKALYVFFSSPEVSKPVLGEKITTKTRRTQRKSQSINLCDLCVFAVEKKTNSK